MIIVRIFLLFVMLVGGLLSCRVYIKRGIQGRLKSATDDYPGRSEQLNKLKKENKISEAVYNQAVTNIKGK